MIRQIRQSGYLAHAAVGIGSLLCAFVMLRLWQANLLFPLSPLEGDALLSQAYVFKGSLENIGYFDNHALGAPWGSNLRDIPQIDPLVFALVNVLGLFTKNHFLIRNLIAIGSYPLVALVSFHVIRRLRIRDELAVVASLLFTFLSFHSLELATEPLLGIGYFTVPFAISLALSMFEKRPLPVATRTKTSRALLETSRGTWATAGICLLMGFTGNICFPLLSCCVLVVSGAIASIRIRSLIPAIRSACLVTIIGAAVTASLLPSILYRCSHGSIATIRQGGDSGLDVAQLVSRRGISSLTAPTPLNGTALSEMAHRSASYLGVVATLGFLSLLFVLLRGRARDQRIEALGAVNASILLVGLSGGFWTVFQLYTVHTFDGLRCLSVYIAYCSLLALALLAERRLSARESKHSRPWLTRVGLAALLLVGLFDQYVPLDFDYEALKQESLATLKFIKRIEDILPPDSSVFEFPNVGFPEQGAIENLSRYGQLIPYLHSDTLRFSYGTMQARRLGDFVSRVATLPTDQAVDNLVLAGFFGIYVARNGYSDHGAQFEAALKPLLGRPTVVSEKHDAAFFTLLSRRDKLHQELGKVEFERRKQDLLSQAYWGWLEGCSPPDSKSGTLLVRCGSEFSFVIENPTSNPIHVAIDAKLRVEHTPIVARFHSEFFDRDMIFEQPSRDFTEGFDVPPGEHRVFVKVTGKGTVGLEPRDTHIVFENPHFSSVVW